MNLLLKRNDFGPAGIFGVLSSVDESFQVALTLEHSYAGKGDPITYIPKLPPGEYLCVKGMHKLANMSQPFETFEVTNVPGHTGILFHVGNYNSDSQGCILLGATRMQYAVTMSKHTFDNFMKLQAAVESFILSVE